ncbi:uncharacterized protein LOC135937738 [Cloeon dipterum]|uniref:uncharacterized protein LOC135937738 n=1 Tax=Cloeon dipterum TaxID=197152 RepID=UPI0032209FB1
MIQCLAEHTGLVYNSTQINLHVHLKMMARMLHPIDVDAIQQVNYDHQTFLSSLDALYDDKTLIFTGELFDDLNTIDDLHSAQFDFATEMMKNTYECSGINITNEETFAFDFLVCLLQSKVLDRFWKFYDFNLEQSSVIPVDHDLTSPCMAFDKFLRYNPSLCIPADGLSPLTETGPYITLKPINIKMLKTSSFTACLERNGSLPYAETKQEFETIYFYIRRLASKLTIIWDQGFYDKINEKFMWCRSDVDPFQPGAKIPIPVAVNATTKQDFVMLVSLPGAKPNLHAVPATDELKYQTDVFCHFPVYVMNECSTRKQSETEEYY